MHEFTVDRTRVRLRLNLNLRYIDLSVDQTVRLKQSSRVLRQGSAAATEARDRRPPREPARTTYFAVHQAVPYQV